jgi:TonB family protein
MLASGTGSQAKAPPLNFIETRLVRLGKRRDPELMPQKETPVSPAAAPAPGATAPAVATKEVAAPRASAQDRLKALAARGVSGALDRLRRTPEGDESGAVDGTVSDPNQTVAGNLYMTKVLGCLRNNFALEGVARDAVAEKSATVFVRIAPDGSLTAFRLVQGSGLDAFDRGVEQAVQRCSKALPPPEDFRQYYQEVGVQLRFRP